MSAKTLYRVSGLALLLGAVLLIVTNILESTVFSSNDPQQLTNPIAQMVTLINVIGSLLLVFGLPGIVARQASRGGWLSLVGFVFTLLGGFLFTSLSLVNLIILPWLAQAAPKLAASNGPGTLFTAYLVAGIAFALGGILLGIAIIRAKIWSRWAGILLIVGAVLNLVDFPLNGPISSIVSILSFILFAGALGWIGYNLMSTGTLEVVEQSVSSIPQARA